MITRITEKMRANVIALVAHGKVSHEDYEKVVIPAVQETIKVHGKVRLFFQLDNDFTGYTAEAIWDDAKVGVHYLTAFERIAVLTDTIWVKDSVRIFSVFVPCPVRVFPNEELPEAVRWINE